MDSGRGGPSRGDRGKGKTSAEGSKKGSKKRAASWEWWESLPEVKNPDQSLPAPPLCAQIKARQDAWLDAQMAEPQPERVRRPETDEEFLQNALRAHLPARGPESDEEFLQNALRARLSAGRADSAESRVVITDDVKALVDDEDEDSSSKAQ